VALCAKKKEKPAIGLGGFIAGSKKDGVFISSPFFSYIPEVQIFCNCF